MVCEIDRAFLLVYVYADSCLKHWWTRILEQLDDVRRAPTIRFQLLRPKNSFVDVHTMLRMAVHQGQQTDLQVCILIERHGGQLWFASVEGEGSTFFLRLPLAVPVALSS